MDTTKLLSDILRFIYFNPHRAWSDQKSYKEVTIINLSSPQSRKVSSEFVKFPTFETDKVKLDDQLA
jgi:hypothetical protein